MNTENANNAAKQLPASFSMGGVTYNVNDNPELLAFRTACAEYGATTEKNKLYSQMEKLREQVKALQLVEVAPSDSPAIDTDKLVQDITNKVIESTKTLLTPLMEMHAESEVEKVERYKQQIIADNAGKCYPTLVEGTTREELDKSMQKSIAFYAANPPANAQGGQQTNTNANTNTGTSTSQNANNNNANANTNTQEATNQSAINARQGNVGDNAGQMIIPGRKDVQPELTINSKKRMSPEEYKANRASLLSQADALLKSN